MRPGVHPRVSVRNPTYSWPSRGLSQFPLREAVSLVEGPGKVPGALRSFIPKRFMLFYVVFIHS